VANQRQMTKIAWWSAAQVVRSFRDAGWPYEAPDGGAARDLCGVRVCGEDGELTPDGERLEKAFDRVLEIMEDRGAL